MITAIIKVKEPNYKPPNIKIRSIISDVIITAEFEDSELDIIKSNPKVQSVSVSDILPLIKQV